MKTNILVIFIGLVMVVTLTYSLSSCTKDKLIPSAGYTNVEARETDAVKGITVRPNPTTGPITVQFMESLPGPYTIQILDTNQNPLMTTTGASVIGLNYVHLNLTSLGKGNYILSFHSSNQNQAIEVSVQYP